MREIRTSGSTRGERAAGLPSPALLLYRLRTHFRAVTKGSGCARTSATLHPSHITRMLIAPTQFRGSWLKLYRSHIEPNLPRVDAVVEFDGWMNRYCQEAAPIFPIRAVTATERRRVYSTSDGTSFAPADNSPAWAVHAVLMEKRLSCYDDFQKLMADIPTHIFDVPRSVKATRAGWYVAHIYPAKNRDTEFLLWCREEVERRFFLTLHPCNFFLMPGVRNRLQGEDPKVIAFMADQYAVRYRFIWADFLNRIHATAIPSQGEFGSEEVESNSGRSWSDAKVATSYRATRLTFKRDRIEPLAPGELFEVVLPMGIYRFTKQDFYSEFTKIAQSASYRERGIYHGKNLHLKAERFRTLP